MKNVLVLYFSQTGQLRKILDTITANFGNEVNVTFAPIELQQPYPFPWKSYDTFFDAMPESVLGLAQEVVSMDSITEKEYDLVILGLQPWFLSPSIPISSFLQSKWAKVLTGKPVVTVIGSRNMWLRCLQKVKGFLHELKARHIGNIVLEDNNKNITSTITIVRWMITGRKEATKRFPEAGIMQKDINDAARFGTIIDDYLKGQLAEDQLQQALLNKGAVTLKPHLMVLERRGARLFPIWAENARKLGLRGDPARQKVLRKFKKVLFVTIFILSPISGALAKLQTILNKKNKTKKDLRYFESTAYEPGKI